MFRRGLHFQALLVLKLCLLLEDGDLGSNMSREVTKVTKVPGLFWSGGAVCRECAFPPENFHFPHSAPGLLTMQVSPDDEVCGIFSVTFKPLHQFDLRSVVFGRVILPSRTYDAMCTLGSTLGSQPVVEITGATLIPRRGTRITSTKAGTTA